MELDKTVWKSGLNSPGSADDQLAGHYEHNSPLGSTKSRKSLNQANDYQHVTDPVQCSYVIISVAFNTQKTALHIHNPYIILLIYY
jgi:hypothetical protein